jgi:hypothetical protein
MISPLILEIAAADRGAAPGRGCGNSAAADEEPAAAAAAAAAAVEGEEEASAARGSLPLPPLAPLPPLSLHASYEGGSATPLMIDSETRRRAAAGSAVWMRA